MAVDAGRPPRRADDVGDAPGSDGRRSRAPQGDERGESADSPTEVPPPAWLEIVKRVRVRVKEENVVLLSAGVAFFGMFAIFPALVAVISLYGLLADPADVQSQVDSLASALPESTQTFLRDQLDRIVSGSSAGLGFALVVSVAVALWSASSGVGHLLEAVNAAYGESSESFVKAKIRSLALALGGVVVMVILVGTLTVLPGLAGEIASWLQALVSWARWPLIAAVMVGVLAVIYRTGANRDDPRWRWTSVGGFVATGMWLLTSGALAIYASTVGSLDATYGSFGGVLVLMLWLLLSALSIILGAYLNAEIEHQTEQDTTVGSERPMGERGARMADAASPEQPYSVEARRSERAQPAAEDGS